MRARKALDTRIATKKSAARVLQRAVRSHIRHPTAQLRLAAGELLDARVAEVRGACFLRPLSTVSSCFARSNSGHSACSN